MATGAELTYQTNASALAMANTIFGSGVTVNSASYSGPSGSSAIYTNGDLAAGVAPSDTGVILSTGDAADFTQLNGDTHRISGTSTNTSGTNNNSLFNDVVGVWVNETHIPITVGNGVTSVNNSNGNPQQNLAIKNANGAYNTEMDGFTVTLTPTMPINVAVVRFIRIGCADASASSYDANLLIAVKYLVNDQPVLSVPGGEVECVHLLFDRHQVVFSAGLATESLLPGPQTTKSFEAETLTKICTLFPEIDPDTGRGYSPAARRTLRGFEARLLAAPDRAA